MTNHISSSARRKKEDRAEKKEKRKKKAIEVLNLIRKNDKTEIKINDVKKRERVATPASCHISFPEYLVHCKKRRKLKKKTFS